MKRRMSWLCGVVLLCCGCPEAHGIGGKIDQAAHADTMESLPQPKCSEMERREHCEGDKKQSQECLDLCGG
jgi:hypothetical protein